MVERSLYESAADYLIHLHDAREHIRSADEVIAMATGTDTCTVTDLYFLGVLARDNAPGILRTYRAQRRFERTLGDHSLSMEIDDNARNLARAEVVASILVLSRTLVDFIAQQQLPADYTSDIVRRQR